MTISKTFLCEKPYGVKVNGVWVFFNTRKEYEKYLTAWIDESYGSIVSFKAHFALDNLYKGKFITE